MKQGTSAAEDPQVEWTSAAEDPPETQEVPEIEEDPQIKGTSAATEHTEIEWTSAANDPPMDEISATEDMDPLLLPPGGMVMGPSLFPQSFPSFLTRPILCSAQPTGPSFLTRPMDPSFIPQAMGPPFVPWARGPSSLAQPTGPLLLPPMVPFSLQKDWPINVTAHAESTESRERTHWPKNSIFRVPEHIRSGARESNFVPKLVSIGPYHHRRPNLKRMQDLKIRCIKEILKMLGIAVKRTDQPRPLEHIQYNSAPMYAMSAGKVVSDKCTLQEETGIDAEFLQQFMVSGRKAQAYYKESFGFFDEGGFVKMLFLDSCFIIRTIFAFSQQTQSMSFLDVHIKEVRSDLLLLDNQIPLFFIKEVYEWFLSNLKAKKLPDFNTVLEPFICLDMPWTINHDAKSREAAHLLDLYWRYSLSPQMDMELISSERYRYETERDVSNSSEIDLSNNALITVIANATELQQMAGIEFEKFKDKAHLDVVFSNGIIRMPRLKIDSRQITLLRNLIAFENCIVPSMRTISCYLKLMDALINSEKDVELLQNSGVIYNTLSSHQMAATFFNDIGDFCFTNDNANPFSGLYKEVQKYYDSPWHRRLASLRHNYFSSPWTGISVVAAVILLILSVVQTFYAIFGYYKPMN